MAEAEDIAWVVIDTYQGGRSCIRVGDASSSLYTKATVVSIQSSGITPTVFDPRGTLFVHLDDGSCVSFNPAKILCVGYVNK